MQNTSWTMSNNYFKAPTGKVVTQWPIGCIVYRALDQGVGPGQRDHPPAAGPVTRT